MDNGTVRIPKPSNMDATIVTLDTSTMATPEMSSAGPTIPASEHVHHMTVSDISVLVLYFIFVLLVGLWSMWRTKRDTVEGYFLAGKDMVWWPVGASLFASNVGSGHFMGLAGSGAASGIAVGAYELNGMFIVLLLAWVFLPIYIASRVDMYAGAVFIQQALRWSLYPSVCVLLAVTVVYTVGGGLAAVIYTDALQTVIMFCGALVLMTISFVEVGGYKGLLEKYPNSTPTIRDTNTSCGLPRSDAFHIFRDARTADFPWPGVLIGMTIPSVWYWCSDQVIVQRSLSARNLLHAKGGSLFASVMKVLPLFMMVMTGMISRVLYPDEVACADSAECERICGNPVGCTDIAYPKLVMELLPSGLRGLMLAVMLAALMSSLTSVFNSASTLFTMDMWSAWRPHATQWELMIVGRTFVIFLVAVSVLWMPIVQEAQGGQLFVYIQAVSSYLQPPIASVFILACFWSRTNESGAFWGLMVGLVAGVARMIIDLVFPEPNCGMPDFAPPGLRLHYLYFSIVAGMLAAVTTILVSLATTSPSKEELGGLLWSTRYKPLTRKLNHHDQPPDGLGDVDNKNGVKMLELTVDDNSHTSGHGIAQCWKTSFLWFCGLNSSTQSSTQAQSEPVQLPVGLREYEGNPLYHKYLNIAALLWMCVGIFLWGFFA
uniref:Sodium/myo-inositol cotransporter 2 n=1 Tax=Eptatretus burgeri TaxID=7764 RepID=A0A8C4N5R7_EPTBU